MATLTETLEFDATNQPLGRLAATVAKTLRGKHRPDFTPQAAPRVRIRVKHVEHLALSARRRSAHRYRYSGYPGGLKDVAFGKAFAQNPERVFRAVVRAMLPENRLRRHLLRNLTFSH
ncbi:MAG: uL13 family ribosomal protein [Candidatus Kerfeldbacteria bacterium]|nr:uL13 family ribosomal protein [Candidatus Kerfeldbacteria bacterium]